MAEVVVKCQNSSTSDERLAWKYDYIHKNSRPQLQCNTNNTAFLDMTNRKN